MGTLYENLLGGTTTDNPLTSGATTINSSAFQYLPTVSGGDVMYLTLDPAGANGAPEIVKVTAHTAAASSVTVVRAQQDTSARSHPSGTAWIHGLTEADVDEFLKVVDTANITDAAVTTAKIADANVTAGKIAADAVTTAKILDSNVTTGKIADLNVTTGKLAADAVNGSKIADDSIDSEHYVDGSIDTAHLADDAVTPAKLSVDYPLGALDYADIASTQTSITTVVDVADLTVTWTADASRRYRTSWYFAASSSVSGDLIEVRCTDASNTQVGVTVSSPLSSVYNYNFRGEVVEDGLSGSVTRKLRALRRDGTGNIAVNASATARCHILVEDIGPA